MFHVVFCILLLFIYMKAVVDQLPLGKRELICLLLFTCNYVVSGCLGRATLFYCGTPLAFHIIILSIDRKHHKEDRQRMASLAC